MSDPTIGYTKKKRSRLPIIIGLIAALAIIAGLIYAISNVSNKSSSSSSEITISVPLEPTNLNIRETGGVALDQVLADNIYEGLVGFVSGTLEVQPVLATDYTVSDDGKSYEFNLREGVKFHSGNELTSRDVVTSLTETLGSMATVDATEEHTVTIELAEANSGLVYLLAGRDGLILEAEATNDLANSANGTGPYLFEEWKQGDSITLIKNDDYWGAPATLDKAVFRYIPDGKAAVNASLDGDLDVQVAVLSTLRTEFDRSDDFNLISASGTDVFTLAYNNNKAPFDDVRVRTAFSQAIDVDEIIAALEGEGKPLGGPITELEPGFLDLTHINSYNPENAQKLLAEAGVENLKVTVTTPNFYDAVVLDIVATQLSEVGVELTINPVEFSTWLEDVYTNKDYDLSYVDHAEAFDFFNYANPDYYFGFDNAEVQKLYSESLQSLSLEDAANKLAEASEVVANEAAAKWLYNYTPTNAISKKVQGFPESNTNSRINLAGVTIVE
ncbi:MAG TPA: ABC transporter substrate-binding protein [Microbacteriaceae bacterium]|nr:ABC transporter substrate-binding protein [Microbacteriaceae bacterium]